MRGPASLQHQKQLAVLKPLSSSLRGGIPATSREDGWRENSTRLSVHPSVASRTEGYEVQFGIVSLLTTELQVVNFQVRQGTARLTSPVVTA